MDRVEQIKKDIALVDEWHKAGKPLSNEQQEFASKIVDEMIGLRGMNKRGVIILEGGEYRRMLKQTDANLGGAVDGTQDAVAIAPSKKKKDRRLTDEAISKALPEVKEKADLPTSEAEKAKTLQYTPDIQNIKQVVPKNQKEGVVSSVADSTEKVTPKDATGQPTEDVESELISHNPNMPMPKKMAEELIGNAQWGVKIGAYTNVKEGIDRQLGRLAYAEFVDTDDKAREVIKYILSLIPATEAIPVA